ncbi:Gfo/Idh/MocA family protein [Snuella sedimenti]|uniref:Gfo/Idh/MocA family oxidoreductase n=1 Tax=Snuella sedimenti TaxID=2798802 RepID=A0A8J7LXF1_9FLAO|nr:Gfo/Idh/MocA family oxidoreductase [Snuella sedimenti]MBJ6366641.1 Gfo/Idh/MocA family oxidoreductase [Snuella sedimenti]
MARKIKLGIIGGGGDSLIGVLHRIASFINDNYEIVGAVFNPVWEENINFAKQIGIKTDRIYVDFDTLIEEELKLPKEERIQVCSVLTPNFLHFPMAKKLLKNGFHVICEKPMTTTFSEAKILQSVLEENNAVFAVTHTYTGYPMVRQMREMIKDGALGKIQKVDAQYYQGWLNPVIHEKEKRASTWRLNPEKAGISCCFGDIGVHAFNMIEFTTGMQIDTILADLNYLYEDNKMDIDGTALVRFNTNAKGVIRSSQVATGEENNLTIAIYGDKGGLRWEQENPNFLYVLSDDKPVQVYKPGHAYNSELSLDGTKLPPGHPEGIFDAMANIYLGVARAIRGEAYNSGEFPTVMDGVRGMSFIEKAVESHQKGNVWLKIED